MNGIIKILIIAGILISNGACSGTSGEGNTNAANTGATNQANNSTASNTNPQMIPYPGTENTNGVVAANSDVKVVTVDPKQLKPTNPGFPAADNSEVISTLNEKGAVETRIFKSHPVLAKIEKTTYGRDIQLKVYLRNGKVVDLPLEKIKNFAGDSAAEILQAAGISQPKPVQNAETGAAVGTKTENTKESKPERPAQTPNAPPLKVPTKP